MTSFIHCENLVKIYKIADLEVVALQGLDLEVQRGEMMALVGASGSGKSTLLNILGGLDTPSAGVVSVSNGDLLSLTEKQRVNYKREYVGFVWQQPSRNLLPYLSAAENVETPMMLSNRPAKERRDRTKMLLDMVGLADRADFRPEQLSGGQQQRVAMAVALANNPPLLLADEPTGQLDSQTAQDIFDLLHRLNDEFKTTILLVTHDPNVAAQVDRVVGIRDGRTSTEIRRERNGTGGDTSEEEWVILDRVGRMQMPKPYLDELAMRGRVKVRLESGHLSVWPGHDVSSESAVNVPQATLVEKQKRKERDFPAVTIKNVWRTFKSEADEVHAVQDVSLSIRAGTFCVLQGRSGSGKTTLLNLIGGLDAVTSGDILLENRSLTDLDEEERLDLRRNTIGFVFQTFGLLPFLSAAENVAAPLRLVRTRRGDRTRRIDEVLGQVGLAERANHRVHELSGGEQQRVALARALANRPDLILADEPTGQLDTETGLEIIQLLRQIVDETGVTVVVASHDPKVANAADHIFEMLDGKLIHRPNPSFN
ncbi:MAG: ABC transporter ATP-binding protein [Anaerolineae bacterium]